MRPISETVTVITGASSGIGRACALALAGQGGKVVLAARRKSALGEAADECRELGGRALVVPTDVTREDEVRRLAEEALANYGRIDAWINNAAVSLFARIEEAPWAEYERVLATNLFGYVFGARAAIPVFREQGKGLLVNVSSVVGALGQPYTSAYVVSKWGIRGLSRSLRMELRDAPGIHVCTVLPGSTDTPIFQNAANHTGRAVKPLEPISPPEAVAATVLGLYAWPRREVYVSPTEKLAVGAHAVAPGAVEALTARKVERDHFEDRPAPATQGNLFQPLHDAPDGGWRRRSVRRRARRRRQMAPGVVAGAVLMALPLGYLAWQRR